jgi:hypothetical protein
VAALAANDVIHLHFVGQEHSFATLPALRLLTHLSFSPDSTKLLAVYEPGMAELWDMTLIRNGLAQLNLEWEDRFPPLPWLTTPIRPSAAD